MTVLRHRTIITPSRCVRSHEETSDSVDHLRCTDDPAMAMTIGPEMADMLRHADVTLRMADIDLLVVLRMDHQQGTIDAAGHRDTVQVLDGSANQRHRTAAHGFDTTPAESDHGRKSVEHLAHARRRTDQHQTPGIQVLQFRKDPAGGHHHRGTAKGMTDNTVEPAEMTLGRNNRFRRYSEIETPSARGAVTGQIKDDDLCTRPAKSKCEIRQIFCSRPPAMHDEESQRPAFAAHSRQLMGRRHSSCECKADRRCLAQALTADAEYLLGLHTLWLPAWRPAKQLEPDTPSQNGRHLLQLRESQTGDLERKGWHSRSSIKMFNNEQ